MHRIISAIEGDLVEATIEVNPETILASPDEYRQLGFTRVSLGIQSLQRDELIRLGRHHDANEAISAIERVSDSGIEYSLDFIYGLPGSSSTISDLEFIYTRFRGPNHLSVYGLTVENGTKLYFRGEDHPIDDEVANSYEAICNFVSDLGLSNYEVSNFAAPGFESLHNLNYWYQGSYIGLGPSAHSFDGRVRSWNVFDSLRWLERFEGGHSTVAGSESLGDDQMAFEAAMLALRTKIGVPISTVADAPFLMDQGLIFIDEGWASLSIRGRMLHSAISNELVLDDPQSIRNEISSKFIATYPKLAL